MAKGKRKRQPEDGCNNGEGGSKKDWWALLNAMPSAQALLIRLGVEKASSLRLLTDQELNHLCQCLSQGDAKRFKREMRRKPAEDDEVTATGEGSSTVLAEPDTGTPKTVGSGRLPFSVDPLDHCETDGRAYADIAVLLNEVAPLLGRTNGSLRIYDPYYCDGGVKKRLAAAGFPNVYNECEDFYEVVRLGQLPSHDIVVTNPPYSQDHIERCITFCIQNRKPWFVCVPNWVHKKEWYQQLIRHGSLAGEPPFYLAPLQRYDYWMPKWVKQEERPEHVGSDGKTSPFLSCWFVMVPGRNEALYEWLDTKAKTEKLGLVVAKTAKGLKWKIQPSLAKQMKEQEATSEEAKTRKKKKKKKAEFQGAAGAQQRREAKVAAYHSSDDGE